MLFVPYCTDLSLGLYSLLVVPCSIVRAICQRRAFIFFFYRFLRRDFVSFFLISEQSSNFMSCANPYILHMFLIWTLIDYVRKIESHTVSCPPLVIAFLCCQLPFTTADDLVHKTNLTLLLRPLPKVS